MQVHKSALAPHEKFACKLYGYIVYFHLIIVGDGGIGKSCSLAMLALDWAENHLPELKQFSFVFLILLRNVNSNKTLESIIIEQHGQLGTMKVTIDEMKIICQGKHDGEVMYIFDGFDEYALGTNSDIDNILMNGKYGSFVIISSRSGDFLHEIRRYSDEEVIITGFSTENMVKCTLNYLRSWRKCSVFLAEAHQTNLDGLLHIPIVLLMACSIFLQYECLPTSVTKLFGKIVDMTISRTTLKSMGKRLKDILNLTVLKRALGKVAWNALQRETKQLLILKVKYIVTCRRGGVSNKPPRAPGSNKTQGQGSFGPSTGGHTLNT